MDSTANDAYEDNEDSDYVPEAYVRGEQYESSGRNSARSNGSLSRTRSVGAGTRNWRKYAQGGFHDR